MHDYLVVSTLSHTTDGLTTQSYYKVSGDYQTQYTDDHKHCTR